MSDTAFGLSRHGFRNLKAVNFNLSAPALYEEAVYDSDGQSLATSFLDYPLPSAREMPRLEMFHLTTPSPINPLGVKGAGEAGTLHFGTRPVPKQVSRSP